MINNTKDSVLIYQMGKVASTTIWETLKKYYTGPVFHSHYFHEKDYMMENPPLSTTEIKSNLVNLYKDLQGKKDKIKIITMVREPISRNLSAFYMNLDKEFRDKNFNNPNLVLNKFISEYPHEIPLNWYDMEFKIVTGIDIFQLDFPIDQQWQTYEIENIEILIFRINIPDALKCNILQNFLDVDEISLVNENIGVNRYYSEGYKNLLSISKFDDKWLHKFLDHKYTKHFYSAEEIIQLRNKWTDNE